jgi:dUTPase
MDFGVSPRNRRISVSVKIDFGFVVLERHKDKNKMATSYYLELFPTSEENWDLYKLWLSGVDVELNNDNAGVDLICVKGSQIENNEKATLLDLGVKARMTKFYFVQTADGPTERSEPCHFWLAPRSSIWKSGVRMANSMGIIDRSYRGALMGAVLPNGLTAEVEPGSRLFQILAPDMGHISKVVLKPLSELDATTRGEGGFGSTGK